MRTCYLCGKEIDIKERYKYAYPMLDGKPHRLNEGGVAHRECQAEAEAEHAERVGHVSHSEGTDHAAT